MLTGLHQIPTETQIKKQLRRLIYGSHLFCPRCHGRQIYRSEDRYRCSDCRRPFTLVSGTWLSSMKVALPTLWALIWCWTQKIPVQQTAKLCSVSEVTTRHYFCLFRTQLPDYAPILEGVIQLDEAYFKSLSLVMAKQEGSRALAHQMISKNSVSKGEATDFLFQHVAPGSNLNTDGASIYRGIESWWPVSHQKDIHKRKEFSQTSEIEGMFGCLRTFIRRMYHHVTPEHLPSVVAEFCLRFSHPELFDSVPNFLSATLINH